MNEFETITEDDLKNWDCTVFAKSYRRDYLLEILRGEYSLDEARKDILSFRKPI